MYLLSSAHPLQALFLKKPEKLHLNGAWKLANFIQKEGAATGCFQQPFALNVRTGKGAFFVAEQLTLQKVFGNGVAVNGDKRAVLMRAATMNCRCRHFFAGAAFSQQEHWSICSGHLANEAKTACICGLVPSMSSKTSDRWLCCNLWYSFSSSTT